MNVREFSHSAIRQLYLELHKVEKQAKGEMKTSQTRGLGLLRMDLVEECRRRLIFIKYMLKDAEDHAGERRRRCLGDESPH
jgi:hypothetical protein